VILLLTWTILTAMQKYNAFWDNIFTLYCNFNLCFKSYHNFTIFVVIKYECNLFFFRNQSLFDKRALRWSITLSSLVDCDTPMRAIWKICAYKKDIFIHWASCIKECWTLRISPKFWNNPNLSYHDMWKEFVNSAQ
jgi:hypothetical protein